jgi:hypothetical protein
MAAQQRAVDRLLICDIDALSRECEQGRSAAGYETKHEIVLRQPLDEIEDAGGGGLAGRVRHRMTCLNNLDTAAVLQAMAVAGDNEP